VLVRTFVYLNAQFHGSTFRSECESKR
jgi:hypothetical protein